LTVRIEDNGTGMDDVVRERAIEPFFTTREPGSGTGLGLAIAYGILENHGANMQINSRLGKGTRVVVSLPLGKSHTR